MFRSFSCFWAQLLLFLLNNGNVQVLYLILNQVVAFINGTNVERGRFSEFLFTARNACFFIDTTQIYNDQLNFHWECHSYNPFIIVNRLIKVCEEQNKEEIILGVFSIKTKMDNAYFIKRGRQGRIIVTFKGNLEMAQL